MVFWVTCVVFNRCNVVVFNSLIDACVRACDLQGAAEAEEWRDGRDHLVFQ